MFLCDFCCSLYIKQIRKLDNNCNLIRKLEIKVLGGS